MSVQEPVTSKRVASIEKGLITAAEFAFQGVLVHAGGSAAAWATLAFQLIDVEDPYDYKSALTTKAALNQTMIYWKNNVEVYQGQGYQAIVDAQLATATNLNEEQQENTRNNALSMWREFELQPDRYSLCFSDMLNTAEPSLSGPPTISCDLQYTQRYNDYVTANRQKYKEENIQSGSNIEDTLNQLNNISASNAVDDDRSGYVLGTVIMGIIIVASLALAGGVYVLLRKRR